MQDFSPVLDVKLLLSLQCPACRRRDVKPQPSVGQSGETFLKLHCKVCGENGFFQLSDSLVAIDSGQLSFTEPFKILNELQQDWREWYDLKRRHLNQSLAVGPRWLKSSQLLMVMLILGGWGFFFTDQIHLLDGIFENPESRQRQIQLYAARIVDLPCLSETMKTKLLITPILYTRERPYHQDHIQYGEAGVYWGEEQIKVYRPNFWFFGLPRRSLLIETLIHEVRHRVSPALGHNAFFYKLVSRDYKCVLDQW